MKLIFPSIEKKQRIIDRKVPLQRDTTFEVEHESTACNGSMWHRKYLLVLRANSTNMTCVVYLQRSVLQFRWDVTEVTLSFVSASFMFGYPLEFGTLVPLHVPQSLTHMFVPTVQCVVGSIAQCVLRCMYQSSRAKLLKPCRPQSIIIVLFCLSRRTFSTSVVYF